MSRHSLIRRAGGRSAFTLIELLVVIAIIGVLVALLLPAVQKVRTAALRMQSINNLKQIGLACHSFESARGYLPWPGTVSPANSAAPDSGPWAYQIMPYIELDNVARSVTATASTREIPIKTFLCPGRGRLPVAVLGTVYNLPTGPVTVGTGHNGAVTDYALNAWINGSLGLDSATQQYVSNDGAGGLKGQPNRQISLGRIPDGTSNTLLVGQKRLVVWQYRVPGVGGYDESLFIINGGVNRNGNVVERDPVLPENTGTNRNWGSPFDGGCPMCMCDGSVQTIRFGTSLDGIGIRKPDDGVVPRLE